MQFGRDPNEYTHTLTHAGFSLCQYPSMFRSRESKAAAATVAHEKEKRQPKYIGNLLKQAKMRAVESDRIFDRKLQKEREEQDKARKE